ncbi:MAG: pilus assembly protein [Acidobacteriaceae bacterium]|nr:pilus assembly protein [Acidobacteriaceae bacterium]
MLAADNTASTQRENLEIRSHWNTITAHHLNDEEGQSLIEFALCVPAFLLVVFGIFVFGLILADKLALTNAASAAAMKLQVVGGNLASPYDPCAVAVAAAEQAAPSLKTANLIFTITLNGVTVPSNATSCTSTSNTTGAAGNLVSGQPAQVTITYPCSTNSFHYGNYFPSCTLSASSSETIQ